MIARLATIASALAACMCSVVRGQCEAWQTGNPVPGTDGTVQSIASWNNGTTTRLAVGGQFTYAGAVAANNVTLWDGTQWQALSGGTDGPVTVVASFGVNLCVAGTFTHAGGVSANHIALWSGSAWSAMGSGISGTVNAAATYSGSLVAGGSFTSAGGVSVSNIARWNGSSWVAMGSGLNGPVSALLTVGSNLYAAGQFTTAGGVSANRIAVWNGSTSTWSALGTGLNGSASSLALSGTDVIVGGSFTTAGGVSAVNVAKWTGTAWSALGSGIPTGPLAAVNAVGVASSTIYAGGTGLGYLYKWTGTAWTTVVSVASDIRALSPYAGVLHAGGNLTATFPGALRNIGKLSGATLLPVGPGLAGSAMASTLYQSEIYVGGTIAADTGVYLARWNGSAWHSVGTTFLNGPALALTPFGSDLIVGGSFSQVGSTSAACVARWNGSAWSAMGSGFSASGNVHVNALAVYGSSSTLAAGGLFTSSGIFLNCLAKWDATTSTWQDLGGGVAEFGVTPEVFALTPYNDGTSSGLIVAGEFTSAGGVSASRIAFWNGTAFSAMGAGFNGAVYAVGLYNGKPVAGGQFTASGATSVNRVARWNPASGAWEPLGSGFNNSVYALQFFADQLYAGGAFTSSGATSTPYAGRWSDSAGAWAAAGAGLAGVPTPVNVRSFSVLSGGLVAVGSFDTAANASGSPFASAGIASWKTPCYVDPNCTGMVDAGDFTIFLNRFNAGDPWANCDNSTTPPVFNILDFTCFQQKAGLGCP